jgi:membrane protease YdiL (CAAX protease family)
MKTKKTKFRLPVPIEFSLIMLVSLGYLIFSAFAWATIDPNSQAVLNYGNDDILQILFYEFTVLLIVMGILKWQGWSISSIGFSISLRKLTAGLAMFVISYFLYVIVFRLFGDFVLNLKILDNSANENITYTVSANLLPLILFSLINPFFEEFILVGYIVTAVRDKMSLFGCLILSVGFRLAFHVYQGPIILLSILPTGIMFTLYYWYKGNLIPSIIAHSLLDFLSFFVFITIENSV